MVERAHQRIVIDDFRALFDQQLDYVERRGFARVIRVPLIGDTDYQYPGALDWLSILVQQRSGLFCHVSRHLRVDLAGQLHQTCLVIQRPHLP